MGDDANWALSDALYGWIRGHLARGTILELGSGAGTDRLAQDYRMISIEHDERWVGKHASTYIHAPIEPFSKVCGVFPHDTGWYSRDVLREELPKHRYDLILVDGPPNSIGRGGFYKWRDLFDLSVPIVLDDVHRGRETTLVRRLSAHLRRPYTVHAAWTDRHFAVILP